MHLSGIADPAAAVFRCIGVDALAVSAGPGYPNTVILPRYWREVADDDGQLVGIAPATQIGNDAFG